MRLRIPVPQILKHRPLALDPSNVLFDHAPAGGESAVNALYCPLEARGSSEDVINGVRSRGAGLQQTGKQVMVE
jgi:hypothetical protein